MVSILAVCVLFVSLVLTVYAEDTIDEGSPYEAMVKGTVYDADTKGPIYNALVTIKYHDILRTDYTDSSGQYIFKHVPECYCLKNMTASKAGYMTQEIWVAVSDVTIVDFYLNPFQNGPEPTGGTVIGWVTDADTNEPIEEAEMTITYHESTQVEYTDSNGQYTFENVPICFCLKNISATKKGYESQYQLIAVSEVTYLNFSLESLDDPEDPEDPEPEDPEDPDPEPEGMYGIITGIVKDATTNNPISEAIMVLKYHDVVRREITDSLGEYTFDKVPMCFCLKDLSAAKNGYETQTEQVAVHEITYVNFSLEPTDDPEPEDPEDPEPEDPEEPDDPEPDDPEDPEETDETPDDGMYGIITGIVTNAMTDKPIAEVLVTLKYHDLVRTELTDSEGLYTFTNVPICFCLKNMTVSKNGYETQYKDVAVSERTVVDFSLNPTNENSNPEQNHNPDENPELDFTTPRGDDSNIKILDYYFALALVGLVLVILVILFIVAHAVKRSKKNP